MTAKIEGIVISEWVKAAALSELEPDYPKHVKLGGIDVALYLVEGSVFATENTCSHAFALLSDGMLEGHEIICPLHGGSFDIRTGEAVSEPCVEPIGTYECRVENGDVFVKMAGA